MAQIYPVPPESPNQSHLLKQKAQSHLTQLKSVELFFEDLEEIEEMFVQSSHKLYIETIDRETNTVAALRQLRQKTISHLTFRGRSENSSITLSLEENNVSLFTDNQHNPVTVGVAARLTKLLQQRRPPFFHRVTRSIWTYGISVIILEMLIARAIANYLFPPHVDQITAGLLVFGIVNLTVAYIVGTLVVTTGRKLGFMRQTWVHLDYKANMPSFWKRQGDSIRVSMLLILVAIIVGWLAQIMNIQLIPIPGP